MKFIPATGAIRDAIKAAEILVAAVLSLGILVYIFNTADYFLVADWKDRQVFFALIDVALLVIIGLELVRLLVTHNFQSILEVLAFVVARKTVDPELGSGDILLGVLAFVIILAAMKYVLPMNRDISEAQKT